MLVSPPNSASATSFPYVSSTLKIHRHFASFWQSSCDVRGIQMLNTLMAYLLCTLLINLSLHHHTRYSLSAETMIIPHLANFFFISLILISIFKPACRHSFAIRFCSVCKRQVTRTTAFLNLQSLH